MRPCLQPGQQSQVDTPSSPAEGPVAHATLGGRDGSEFSRHNRVRLLHRVGGQVLTSPARDARGETVPPSPTRRCPVCEGPSSRRPQSRERRGRTPAGPGPPAGSARTPCPHPTGGGGQARRSGVLTRDRAPGSHPSGWACPPEEERGSQPPGPRGPTGTRPESTGSTMTKCTHRLGGLTSGFEGALLAAPGAAPRCPGSGRLARCRSRTCPSCPQPAQSGWSPAPGTPRAPLPPGLLPPSLGAPPSATPRQDDPCPRPLPSCHKQTTVHRPTPHWEPPRVGAGVTGGVLLPLPLMPRPGGCVRLPTQGPGSPGGDGGEPGLRSGRPAGLRRAAAPLPAAQRERRL